jgi:YesN/AraC family two-component response regulator
MVLKEHLTQAGHEIIEADDGKHGLEICQKESMDLVITDIFMPRQDGLATITELKARFPSLKIIAISDGGSVVKSYDYLEHAKDFGAAKVYRKTVDVDDLLSSIPQILRSA